MTESSRLQALGGTEASVTKIADLTRNTRNVTVEFKVIYKRNPRVVMSKRSGKRLLVADARVADSSAQIELVLWNEEAEEIEQGSVYRLTNGTVIVHEESLQLGRGRNGCFTRLPTKEMATNESLDMSVPFLGGRKKRVTSSSGRTFDGVSGREAKGYCSSKGF